MQVVAAPSTGRKAMVCCCGRLGLAKAGGRGLGQGLGKATGRCKGTQGCSWAMNSGEGLAEVVVRGMV